MKKLILFSAALVMVVLSGCVPTGQSGGSAGSSASNQIPPPPTNMPPLPEDWQVQFESSPTVKAKFKDPSSVIFTYVGQPTLCQFGIRGAGNFLPGYCGFALVNAKNSFGGYVGDQAAAYYFHAVNNEKTGNKTRIVMPILQVGEAEVSRVITNPNLRNR